MPTETDRHGVHGSADITRVEIPADIVAAFDDTPDRMHGCAIEWTPVMDAIIIKYHDVKTYPVIARIISEKIKKVSDKAIMKRYAELSRHSSTGG
jgi:hypothetical protein